MKDLPPASCQPLIPHICFVSSLLHGPSPATDRCTLSASGRSSSQNRQVLKAVQCFKLLIIVMIMMTTDNSTLRKLWEKSLWQVGYYWDKAVPSSFYPEFLQMFSTPLGQILPPKTDNRDWNTNSA